MAMRSEASVGRGVVIIVLAGVALGLAHNGLGLMGHPPRGIPWVAAEEALPNLESLLGPSGEAGASAGQGAPMAAGNAAPPSSPGPARGDRVGGGTQPAARAAGGPKPATPMPTIPRASHPGDGSPPVVRSSTPEESGPAATGSASASSSPSGVAAPPDVPDLDRPVQVELATVKKFFDAGAALFLDARDAAEYEAGHIPGALRLTRDDALAEPERVKRLPGSGKPIIAYCEGGTCEASLDLARALVEAGYRKVLVYGGGFPEWAAAGYAVERGGGSR